MLPLLPTSRDWPLHDAATSRSVEAAALARHPPHALIERAGLAVARLALAVAPHARTAVVFAGPGNNGGDGLIAARHLSQRGWRVDVMLVGGPPKPGGDGAHARLSAEAALASGATELRLLEGLADLPAAGDVVIDALLGLGASRAPEGAVAAAIAAIARLQAGGATVLAVDLPSGLHARTGQPLGVEVVRADHTLTLLTIKTGLLTGEGREACGRIWFDDLAGPRGGGGVGNDSGDHRSNQGTVGALDSGIATLIGRERVERWQHAHARTATSHKGRHGDVVVLGGAPSMRGAAWLAASAALAAGAGRVYAALPDDDGQPWPARPELMHWDFSRWDTSASTWRDVVAVCGCGGGSAITRPLSTVLHGATRIVLDADALNLVATDEALQQAVRDRRARGQATVMTPHPLEAARLLGLAAASQVQADRLGAAQALAERFESCVVLKGSGSIVAMRDHMPAINGTGSSALATAGTGDVLAGWLGGLWAQSPAIDPHALACAAVAWHGAAAEGHAGPLLAADLVRAMAALHAAAP